MNVHIVDTQFHKNKLYDSLTTLTPNLQFTFRNNTTSNQVGSSSVYTYTKMSNVHHIGRLVTDRSHEMATLELPWNLAREVAISNYRTFIQENRDDTAARAQADLVYNEYLATQESREGFTLIMQRIMESTRRSDPYKSRFDVLGWNPERMKQASLWFCERDKSINWNLLEFLRRAPDDDVVNIYVALPIFVRKNLSAVCRKFLEIEKHTLPTRGFVTLSTYNTKYVYSAQLSKAISICKVTSPILRESILQQNVIKQIDTDVNIDVNMGISFTVGKQKILIPVDDNTFWDLPTISKLREEHTHLSPPSPCKIVRHAFFKNLTTPLYHFFVILTFHMLNEGLTRMTIAMQQNGYTHDEMILDGSIRRPKRRRSQKLRDDDDDDEDDSEDDEISFPEELKEELQRIMDENKFIKIQNFQALLFKADIPNYIATSFFYSCGEKFCPILHFRRINPIVVRDNNLFYVLEFPREFVGTHVAIHGHHQVEPSHIRNMIDSADCEFDFPNSGFVREELEANGINKKIIHTPQFYPHMGDGWFMSFPGGATVLGARRLNNDQVHFMQAAIASRMYNNKTLPPYALLGHTWRFSKSLPEDRATVEGFLSLHKLLRPPEGVQEGTTIPLEPKIHMGHILMRFPNNGCIQFGKWYCYPTGYLRCLWDVVQEGLEMRGGMWW